MFSCTYGAFHSTYPFVPYMARRSHSPMSRAGLELFLSSTWGRADQQTSRDSNRVWGVLFCGQNRFSGGRVRAMHGTGEPFTGFEVRHRVVLEQHLGEV